MERTADTPAFVIVRDLLDWTRKTVAGLEAGGIEEIYLVDNASTYPPLLDWYEETAHTVIRLGGNYGKKGPWAHGPLKRHTRGRRFLLTDPDVVPTADCPGDWVERFHWILDRYKGLQKVGFSLVTDDLPARYAFRDEVRIRNAQFWDPDKLDRRHRVGYRVPLDTTMALYRENSPYCTWPAIRTRPPYVAHHLAWYLDSANPPDDVRYYREHASWRYGHWAKKQLPDRLGKRLEQRIRGTRPKPKFRQR